MIHRSISKAAFHGDLAEVRRFLASGDSVEEVDDKDHDVLHNAIASGNVDLVELVLRKGALVNRIDATGWSPLMHAINCECDAARQRGQESSPLAMVRLLSSHGADPRQKDFNGRDAFFFARIYPEFGLSSILNEAHKASNSR